MPRNQFITIREGTAAAWTSANPILAQGELGYETDTGKFKLGNAVSTWTALPYGGLNGPQTTAITKSFGTGADGNVTISSGVVVMTRDMYYNNLTINGTGSLVTNGYELFVAGTLDISAAPAGAIQADGLNGTNANGPTGFTSPAVPIAVTVGVGGQGAAGKNGVANAAVIGNPSTVVALGNGGAGGNGGGTTENNGVTTTDWLTRKSTNGGISWATVDDYQYPGGTNAFQIDNCVDSSGNIYSAGYGRDSIGTNHFLVRKSTDHGATWTTVDDFVYTAITNNQALGIGIDLLGNIYAVGFSTGHWIVRKSTNGGTSWATVDDYIYPGGIGPQQAFGFGVDTLGNVYVMGLGENSAGLERWIVRQSANNGSTWTTTDDFINSPGQIAQAHCFLQDLLGNVYIAGDGRNVSGVNQWVVRQSPNNGVTWTTVDNYQYPSGTTTIAYAMGLDNSGNIYVSGFYVLAGSSHWLVRKSTDNGVTWANVDDFLYSNGNNSESYGFNKDSSGNLYAVGFGVDGSNVFHWLVRKSTDQGATWITMDDFNYPGGNHSQAFAVSIDSSGNIYVGGYGTNLNLLSQPGSTGGIGSSPTTSFSIRRYDTLLFKGITQISGGVGGASGAPGTGNGYLSGGGSGSGGNGGGVLAIYANIINRGPGTAVGAIQSNGGNGGNGDYYHNVTSVSVSGGGGGGGGGGWVYIAYNSLTGSVATNAVEADGGNGGSGGNANGSGAVPTGRSLITRKSTNQGSTWTTVDTFLYPGGMFSDGFGVGGDLAGNIFTSGRGYDDVSNPHGIVRKSADHGVTWTTVDDIFGGPFGTVGEGPVAIDTSGNIYVPETSASNPSWIIRKSANNGTTWTSLDSYSTSGGAAPEAFIQDSSGNLYACGVSGTPNTWTVRVSTNSGATWNTVDFFILPGGNYGFACGMTADSLGNVYVTGSSYDGSQYWSVIRMTSNAGVSWTTVDKYNLFSPTGAATGFGMCVDLLGNVYNVSNASDSLGVYHWIVRKSANQGASWTTVDDFQYITGLQSIPQCICVDQLGNIYVGGQANDASGNINWIVRKSTNNGATWSTVDTFLFTGGTITYAQGVGVDTLGNIYVTGGTTTPAAFPNLAGIGGNGGAGGEITLVNVTTSVVTQIIGSAGAAGSNPVSGIGGVGGAGNVVQENL
jgi:hypothetical protein